MTHGVAVGVGDSVGVGWGIAVTAGSAVDVGFLGRKGLDNIWSTLPGSVCLDSAFPKCLSHLARAGVFSKRIHSRHTRQVQGLQSQRLGVYALEIVSVNDTRFVVSHVVVGNFGQISELREVLSCFSKIAFDCAKCLSNGVQDLIVTQSLSHTPGSFWYSPLVVDAGKV